MAYTVVYEDNDIVAADTTVGQGNYTVQVVARRDGQAIELVAYARVNDRVQHEFMHTRIMCNTVGQLKAAVADFQQRAANQPERVYFNAICPPLYRRRVRAS